MKNKDLFQRLKNTGTIIGITSFIIIILTVNGFEVDDERIMTTVQCLCSIGVIIGFLNNSETPGIDIPVKHYKIKEVDKEDRVP